MKAKPRAFFDSEDNLFSIVNSLYKSFVIIPFSISNLITYFKLALPINRSQWLDNSKNTNNPPDFISKRFKIMCEFMRVNEYELEKGVNPYLSHEREVLGKLRFPEDSYVYLLPDGEKLFGMRHDYDMYLNMIERVLLQHNQKIQRYKQNHKGYKAVFVVFDESSLYVESDRHYEPEEMVYGKPFMAKRLHKPYYDSNILHIIGKLECDYVLWVNPFKRHCLLANSKNSFISIPSMGLIEVGKVNKGKGIRYDKLRLVSVEATVKNNNSKTI